MSDSENDKTKKRRFWQIHFFAVVVALFALTAMLWENYRPARVLTVQQVSQEQTEQNYEITFRFTGWPLAERGRTIIRTNSLRFAWTLARDHVNGEVRHRGPEGVQLVNICTVIGASTAILVFAECLLRKRKPKLKHLPSSAVNFHLTTAILTSLVLGALLGMNLVWFNTEDDYEYEWYRASDDLEIVDTSSPPHSVHSQIRGWPATVSVRDVAEKNRSPVVPIGYFSESLALSLNVSFALAILGATISISEFLIRRKGRRT